MSKTKEKVTSKSLLKEIYTNAKLENGFLDVYSVNSVHIPEILKLREYKEIVDWSCIFHTIFDTYDQLARPDKKSIKLDNVTTANLADRAHKYLLSLPLCYHFLLPLPRGLKLDNAIKINKEVVIEGLDKTELDKYIKANPDLNNSKSSLATLLASGTFGPDISFRRPSSDITYLNIKCTGYVANGNSTVYELDPMYTYKILFSMCFVFGYLKPDNSISSPYADEFSKFAFKAFYNNHEFVTTISRPIDEAKLINKHKFIREEKDFKLLMMFFRELISKQKVPANEKLRNQIINSLFWYFEVKKTENPNMQTVLFTSVFDAFFTQTDKSNEKARMIALDCSETVNEQNLADKEIFALYTSRNQIIHGDRPLLEYQIYGKKSDEIERARIQVGITRFYNKYLQSKLNRYAKSVGLIKYTNSI